MGIFGHVLIHDFWSCILKNGRLLLNLSRKIDNDTTGDLSGYGVCLSFFFWAPRGVNHHDPYSPFSNDAHIYSDFGCIAIQNFGLPGDIPVPASSVFSLVSVFGFCSFRRRDTT